MKVRTLALLLACATFAAGCATRVTEEAAAVQPSERPFGDFDRVLLVKSELVEPYAGQGANIKAANRIDLVLAQRIGPMLNHVEVYSANEVRNMDLDGTRTLLIRPVIKQIKFLNVGTRLLTGPTAGSGVVIIDTEFVDGATGDVLANPGYYRKAGAWASTFSSADNRMLTAVAGDIASYTRRYRCSPGDRWERVEPETDEERARRASGEPPAFPAPRHCVA